MGMLDGILGQIGGGDMAIDAIATKFGIPPELAEKAVAALGQSHAEEGDTIAGAAAKTGLDSGMLGQLADHLGGAGGLGQLSGLLQGAGGLSGLSQILDRDGDGNPLDDIAGIAKGLLG